MRVPGRLAGRGGRWAGAARALVLVLALAPGVAGCAAGEPAPRPPEPSVAGDGAASTGTPPADGVTLAGLGFANGPVRSFALPPGSVLDARVDQPNNVTLVLAAPAPAELLAWFRRTLPPAGFRIDADRPEADTLTFTGYGWAGTVTGRAGTSAILLRPA